MELQQILFDKDFVTTGGGYSIRPFLLHAADPTKWRITDVDYEGAVRRLEAANDSRLVRGLLDRLAIVRWISVALGADVANTHSASTSNAKASGHRATSRRQRPSKYGKIAQFGIHFCQEPELYTRAWQLTHRILSHLETKVAEVGAQLVVFSVPSYASVEKRVEERIRSRFTRGTICIDQAPGHRRLAQILEQESIPFVDLLDSFREAAAAGANLFRVSDSHWNEAGHTLAAELVASELKARGFLER